MCTHKAWRRNGFVLIEALVALLLISVGLLAISKLQVLSVSGVGEARSYSRAMAISQQKLEQLRNILFLSQFTGAVAPLVPGSEVVPPVAGDNASYTLTWAVEPDPSAVAPVPPVEQRVLRLRTTWTDRYGQNKSLDLSSVIAWDDPGARVNATPAGGLPQIVTPTGDAVRSKNPVPYSPGVGIANPDGSRIHTRGDNVTELLSSTGRVLLELPPLNDSAQSFTTISGKVYFDQSELAQIPASNFVRLRLSSEGECIFNNAVASLVTASGGFKYFTYTCYVGRGWYGNVGVVVDAGGTGNPTVCVGDPGFNGGVSDNTLISPHAAPSATRSYRGFKGSPGAYISTGVKAGIKFGIGTPPDVAGLPVPSGYAEYAIAAGTATDYFEQNFLVTRINGQLTGEKCALKMAGGVFARNAGKYVCISPDNDLVAADQCPAIWPSFENQVGSGNGVVLTVVVPAGASSGTVTSDPVGINCGATCQASFASGTSITLTATPAVGFAFGGWSGGGCTGMAATCTTVGLTAAATVTASFNSTATYDLTVSLAGAGSVSSSPGGISCGATCTASYNPGTQVTLTAAPAPGSMFSGWTGGGCSMDPAPCTVALNATTGVTATFVAAPAYSLTVAKGGSGTGGVTSLAAGIDCGSTCTAAFAQNESVTLTATPTGGSTFGVWGGACNGSGACVVSVSGALNVTATFIAPVANYQVAVTKAGAGAATGTVTSSPGGINCGTTCTGSFAAGTTVVLTASTTSGTFTGWSGGVCSGTGTTCTIPSIAAAKSVTATFGACITFIDGSRFSKFGNVAVAASAGSCTMENGNAGYNCSLTALAGTQVALTDSAAAQGRDPAYSYSRTVTATCGPQTINFPSGP